MNYWEGRREVFGPEKFHLRMTLSEALRDDLVAIKSGMFSILPHPDLSGRPLWYLAAARCTCEGYTKESMVSDYYGSSYELAIDVTLFL